MLCSARSAQLAHARQAPTPGFRPPPLTRTLPSSILPSRSVSTSPTPHCEHIRWHQPPGMVMIITWPPVPMMTSSIFSTCPPLAMACSSTSTASQMAREAQAMMNRQRNPPDAIMNDAGASSMMPQGAGMMHGQPAQINPSGPPHTSAAAQMIPTTAPASDSISSIDAQIQYLQQQKFQQQQRQIQEQRNAFFASQNHSVPPTPQSIEMPPGSGNFYTQEQMSHEVYDGGYHQQQRMKERQDMAFTPLVSPAVTPLETHYMENNFTAYFSPLTSPALHAQNDSSSIYDPSTQSNNSPIEMDLEMSQAPVVVPMELSKKARENNAAKTRSRAGGLETRPSRNHCGARPVPARPSYRKFSVKWMNGAN
uniref:Uncharacterized protein n=1 Tax=Bionectria ochroleuca TaxID=29856 RepID=A0A8H7TPE5_BIOOC